MAEESGKRRSGCRCCGLVVLIVVVAVAAFYGPVVKDFYDRGILQALLAPEKKREYAGNSMENLKASYTAMMLYHESEGLFPESSGWMDAIEDRLRTADLPKEEAEKKLRHPDLAPDPDVYGYAMNDAASQKYKDDIQDPAKTPLLFDSSDTSRNAHGSPDRLLPDPPRTGGNKGISVEGSVLDL